MSDGCAGQWASAASPDSLSRRANRESAAPGRQLAPTTSWLRPLLREPERGGPSRSRLLGMGGAAVGQLQLLLQLLAGLSLRPPAGECAEGGRGRGERAWRELSGAPGAEGAARRGRPEPLARSSELSLAAVLNASRAGAGRLGELRRCGPQQHLPPSFAGDPAPFWNGLAILRPSGPAPAGGISFQPKDPAVLTGRGREAAVEGQRSGV